MKNQFVMLYLLILIGLSFSCTQSEKTIIGESEFDTSDEVGTPETEILLDEVHDTLKYTTGTRSIFQDSKGRYWFGSHKEGVYSYDGKSFTYFTTNDGLSSNQVRTIQEDKHGTIWFRTSEGVCSFDGKKITNYRKEKLTGNLKFSTNNN
ncbi:MAG: two-component regulator propeller domain-containing protein [Spirosomataceae bacterium]|jgi:ligand-binding sensor domain-containing protein